MTFTNEELRNFVASFYSDSTVKALAAQCLAYKRDAERRCEWTEDADGNWHTACENIFVFMDGSPADNDFIYCCYCAGKITQCSWQQLSYDDEDAALSASAGEPT